MPTTNDEAEKVVGIARKYMTSGDMAACFLDLDEKVGKVSENSSVRETFAMLRQVVEGMARAQVEVHPEPRLLWLAAWLAVWALHIFLVLGNLASFLVAPFFAPWYLAFPACFAIVWVTCSPVNCVLTSWENEVRLKLGWRPVRSFIGHYFLKPVYLALRHLKRG